MQPQPPASRSHYLWSAALVERAHRRSQEARASGPSAVADVIVAHQAAAAFQAPRAVSLMLSQQGLRVPAQAALNTVAFTTDLTSIGSMLEKVATDFEFTRLVTSLVQDAGRSAEQVATAVTPRTGYVRYLSPPSCSRCAVLAGRVYRYSEGFLRHPGCDCVMVPTALADPAAFADPMDLVRAGKVTGLSKADRKALEDGADLARVVNVRRSAAGLRTPGRVLTRRGRPTPEGIYSAATSRDDAIQRLISAGYVR